MLKNTGNRVYDVDTNQVVFYQPSNNSNKGRPKKAYPVIINNGAWKVEGRLSNFWYWQRLTPTGRIKPEIEHGYGNFYIVEGYEVQRMVVIKK